MLTSSLHTKWIVRFFVLIYLLLITSTGNAFFWCKGAEASHLEVNLSGTCWTPCLPGSSRHQGNEQTSDTMAAFSAEIADCIDSPAYSSLITPATPNSPKSKVTVTEINASDSPFCLANCLSAECLGNPPLAHKLPPRQTLTALRTVVLLH